MQKNVIDLASSSCYTSPLGQDRKSGGYVLSMHSVIVLILHLRLCLKDADNSEGGIMGKAPVLSPTDIIAGIVACLFDSNVTEFPTCLLSVHKALFQLRQELGGILQHIPFDTRDIYPYSPAVDEAISNMQATDDLQRNNPQMARFKIGASAKNYFDTILAAEFSAKQKEEMKAIAKRLAEALELQKTGLVCPHAGT